MLFPGLYSWRKMVHEWLSRTPVSSLRARRRRRQFPTIPNIPPAEVLEQRILLSAGLLDTSFGDNGLVTTDFPASGEEFDRAPGQDFARDAVTIQPDGKIALATTSEGGNDNEHFALVRYQSNGRLDDSFGTDGYALTDLSTGVDRLSSDWAAGLAVDDSGRIVVVGTSDDAQGNRTLTHELARTFSR